MLQIHQKTALVCSTVLSKQWSHTSNKWVTLSTTLHSQHCPACCLCARRMSLLNCQEVERDGILESPTWGAYEFHFGPQSVALWRIPHLPTSLFNRWSHAQTLCPVAKCCLFAIGSHLPQAKLATAGTTFLDVLKKPRKSKNYFPKGLLSKANQKKNRLCCPLLSRLLSIKFYLRIVGGRVRS